MIRSGIDVTNMERSLSALLGSMQALQSTDVKRHITKTAAVIVEREFNRFADTNASQIPHMYEYGLEGNPAGRLWMINWMTRNSDTVGTYSFKPSSELVPLSSEQEDEQRRKDIEFSRHKFVQKAAAMENRAYFVLTAGRARHREFYGSTGRPARMLVQFPGGERRFFRRLVIMNEYQGRFNRLWATYWGSQAPQQVARHLQPNTKRLATEINREVQPKHTGTRFIPTGPSPMQMSSKGRRIAKMNIKPDKQTMDRIKNKIKRFWR